MELRHVRNLAMNGEEEWTCLDVIEVKSIDARSEVERAEHCTLVREQGTIHEVNRSCMLLAMSV